MFGSRDICSKLVSLVLPVHNGGTFVSSAIDSILHQDYPHIEIVVINDGSTDDTLSIVAGINSSRCRVVSHPERMGHAAAHNHGLKLAQGEYVAIMHADDICRPARLRRQVEYLEKHPDVGICGGWIRTLGEVPPRTLRYPCNPAAVHSELLFNCSLAHPTVMLRRSLLETRRLRYDSAYDSVEDYDLWTRCARHTQIGNVGEVVLEYRSHANQTSVTKRHQMLRLLDDIRATLLRQLGIEPSVEEVALHSAIARWDFSTSSAFVAAAGKWLEKLQAYNSSAGQYPEPAFSKSLAAKWYGICNMAADQGTGAWRTFRHSPFARHVPRWKRMFVAAKCLGKDARRRLTSRLTS